MCPRALPLCRCVLVLQLLHDLHWPWQQLCVYCESLNALSPDHCVLSAAVQQQWQWWQCLCVLEQLKCVAYQYTNILVFVSILSLCVLYETCVWPCAAAFLHCICWQTMLLPCATYSAALLCSSWLENPWFCSHLWGSCSGSCRVGLNYRWSCARVSQSPTAAAFALRPCCVLLFAVVLQPCSCFVFGSGGLYSVSWHYTTPIRYVRARGVTNFGGCSSLEAAHGMQILALACCSSFSCTMLRCACELHGNTLVNQLLEGTSCCDTHRHVLKNSPS